MVLDGAITLVFGEQRCVFGPGDSCSVPAGTLREEHNEADCVHHESGRPPSASPASAA